MTRRAEIDPRLGVRVLSSRLLHYDSPAEPADDRPAHVRAASGLAVQGGRLVVAQDDAAFLAVVATDGVSAIQLPRGIDGRRRFELALGNKHDKLDLESCIAIDDELWAFGSGSLPVRDKICRIRRAIARVFDAAPFYARLRAAIGSAINLEGVARVGTELWLFHRGNTGGVDHGPAVLEVQLETLRTWLDGRGPLPGIERMEVYDLGTIAGHRLGFTDAFADRKGVFYLAAAEAGADAVADGRVIGSHLGVITPDAVRAAPLRSAEGAPVKAEGLALDPGRPGHAWIVLDPDDPEQPATLLEVELNGPW
jgi:hypothetical protein